MPLIFTTTLRGEDVDVHVLEYEEHCAGTFDTPPSGVFEYYITFAGTSKHFACDLTLDEDYSLLRQYEDYLDLLEKSSYG